MTVGLMDHRAVKVHAARLAAEISRPSYFGSLKVPPAARMAILRNRVRNFAKRFADAWAVLRGDADICRGDC